MIRLLAIVCATACLSSCFDSHEEVWINADASGMTQIQVSLPALAVRLQGGEEAVVQSIEDYFEATPAFNSYKVSSQANGTQIDLEILCSFKNVLELADLTSQPAIKKLPGNVPSLLGKTTVGFQSLNVDYRRDVDLPKAIPAATFLPKSKLQGHSVTTVFHLPKAPTVHNADSTSNQGRTLTWVTPLDEALTQPMVTRFTMPLPIPWLTIAVVSLTLIILVGAMFIYFRRGRKKAKETLS
ncbi:MAG: hypothetical protein AB8D78_15365 [Akkermansiaceae bacterium]